MPCPRRLIVGASKIRNDTEYFNMSMENTVFEPIKLLIIYGKSVFPFFPHH